MDLTTLDEMKKLESDVNLVESTAGPAPGGNVRCAAPVAVSAKIEDAIANWRRFSWCNMHIADGVRNCGQPGGAHAAAADLLDACAD